jgi:hypothetical protein
VGDWYWIGLAAGLGTAAGLLLSSLAGWGRVGTVAALVLGAGAGLGIGLAIGEWDEAAAGAIGGVLGSLGAGQVVSGAFRRGATRGGAAVWVAAGALLAAAFALIPGVGYLEAAAAPLLGARLRRRAPAKFAGLRTLAR